MWARRTSGNFRKRKSSSPPASRPKASCSRQSRASGWGRGDVAECTNQNQTTLNAVMNTQTTKTSFKTTSLLALLALVPVLASAHPGHGTHGFASGFSHPLLGLDHILAMVAVGLWAAQLGGRSLWAVPATFVGVMSVGGMLGLLGVPLPMVEAGILASVLILGLFIATAVRLPLAASMLLVGAFALFHGHAHGTEIPATASGLTYGLGF